MALSFEKISRYGSENKEYKDQARKILCDRLGFEPDILISHLAELHLRHSLKIMADGKITLKKFEEKITFCAMVVNKWQEEPPKSKYKTKKGEPDLYDYEWIREVALSSDEVQRLLKERRKLLDELEQQQSED